MRALITLVIAAGLSLGTPAFAGARDQARRLYSSLTGGVPAKAYLDELTKLVAAGKAQDAAQKIIQDSPSFYSVTVKTMATRWTNRDHSIYFPLNDFSATVIGAVRDDLQFGRILWDDLVYYADGQLTGANNDQVLLKNDVVVPMYFRGDNKHYEALEREDVDLRDPETLKRYSQVPVIHKLAEATAGVMSTRAFGEAFFQAGTNRRATAFVLENFLCKSMDKLNDTTRPDYRVRRDVDRSPGGDSRTYKALCVGCHSGMDALSGAFSYYDFRVGYLFYERGEPAATSKVNHNVLFPDGYITTSDSWVNQWTQGQNSTLGWPKTAAGNGAKALGKMLSQTAAFPACMSKQVFEQVCFRTPKETEELALVKALADRFTASKQNMKALFADTAVACMGE
jgi:hypothetical protein